MLKKIGKGILMVIGYFFALWPITVPLIIWIAENAENNNLGKTITFNFDKAVTFIKELPIELSVVSAVVIICVIITITINIYLKKHYRTDYAAFLKREQEFNKYRESERKRIADEARDLQNLKRSLVQDTALRPYVCNTQTYTHIVRNDEFDRFINFIYGETHGSPHIIKNLSISAQIETTDSKTYNTTLDGCDCPDYKYNLRGSSPCKHMYMLAHTLTLFNNCSLDVLNMRLGKKIEEYDNKRKNLYSEQQILNSKRQSFPFAAKLLASTIEESCLHTAEELTFKKNPALKSADKLRKYATELRQWTTRAKLAENQLAFYEELFPWLEEFKEIPPNDAWDMVKGANSAESEYDHYKNWLSPEEYNRLSKIERNQLALDRYKKRHKTNWEIGIEYERYVGYKYEMRGFRVSYIGATRGLEDMGRDLVAQGDGKTYIIQCKRWAQEKTIHEKHIFQLYGTTVLYKMSHPEENIQPLFVTTADLSDTAKEVADYLGITIVNNYIVEDYPLIKCNIGKDGEKIYHLPFDQQYDHVVVVPSKGEGYAYTIEEAERLGFRHAFRWHSA